MPIYRCLIQHIKPNANAHGRGCACDGQSSPRKRQALFTNPDPVQSLKVSTGWYNSHLQTAAIRTETCISDSSHRHFQSVSSHWAVHSFSRTFKWPALRGHAIFCQVLCFPCRPGWEKSLYELLLIPLLLHPWDTSVSLTAASTINCPGREAGRTGPN